MKPTPTIERQAQAIINELFNDLQDRGAIETYIPESNHTTDFQLPDGLLMRVKEERHSCYYNVFRMS